MMMTWHSLYILDGIEYNKRIPAEVTQNNHCIIKLNKVRFKSLLTVSASDELINIVILVRVNPPELATCSAVSP